MRSSLAVQIDHLVSTMMIELVKGIGSVDQKINPGMSDTYVKMESIRQEISTALMDHLDTQEGLNT